MTALPLALSLSSSFTQIGALVAFAALVGIAVMSLLFFSQARELKRLREWADAEPERTAERDQRLSAAVALRIQRATAQVARPLEGARPVQAPAGEGAPVAAANAAGAATRVAKEAHVLALLPAAPAIVGTGKATPETVAEAPRSEAAVVVLSPADTQAEQAPPERAPAVAAVAGSATAVAARAVEAPPRSPAPPPPVVPAAPPPRRSEPERATVADREAVPVVAGRGAAPEAPPAPRRTAESSSASRRAAESPAAPRRAAPREKTQGSPPPRRRGRGGPPPGPPFLREEPRRGSRLPLLLVGVAVVAIVVLLVVVLGSGGSSPSSSKGAKANLSSSSTLTSTESHRSSSTTTQPSEASTPATSPSETHVVVLNSTETAGLARRLSTNLQQSGYTLASALAGRPSAHSTSVVQYAAGHRTDAEHVAQTLEISQVQPLEAATAALSSGATVVVIAGQDKSSAP